MEPANMNYMVQQDPQTSYPAQPSFSQTQQSTQPTTTTTQSQQNANIPLRQKISLFLHTPTGTVLAAGIGMAIGFALKDFVGAFVTSLLEPTIVKVLLLMHLGDFYDFQDLISPKSNAINVTAFISNSLTFLFTLIAVYFLAKLL
jgi:large-conductance mechanosensitive channel